LSLENFRQKLNIGVNTSQYTAWIKTCVYGVVNESKKDKRGEVITNEANVSAKQYKACQKAWLFKTDVHKGRQKNYQQKATKRKKAAGSLNAIQRTYRRFVRKD